MVQPGALGSSAVRQPRTEVRDADFTAYMQARQTTLLRTAYLLCGDYATAEDLVQTTLAKLYLKWDTVRSRDSLDGFVRRILVNEHNSLWRRAWKRVEFTTDQPPEVRGAGPDEYADFHDQLWSFVGSLPRRQRAVVVLRYYEQLTEAEVADVLGCSVGTVKSQASRALAALRERAPQSLNPHLPTTGEEESR